MEGKACKYACVGKACKYACVEGKNLLHNTLGQCFHYYILLCLKHIFMFLWQCFAISYIVPCEILQSTTNIVVNLTSTAMGSNATYQCRDGPSDVYTTQCTSDGVWEPNPNSVLYCRTPGTIPSFLHVCSCYYSGTPLNGHSSTADTHVISDSSESPDSPDCHSVDFNTLEPPE